MPDNKYKDYLKNKNIVLPSTSSSESISTENNDFGKSQYDDSDISANAIKSGEYKYYRGERQSWLDKAANGTIRLAGRAVTSGAEGILTPFVGTFYAIKDNKFSSFYDNPVAKGLDEIDKGIKDSLPLYNTREAEEATGFSKLKYANTLFNDIFDGIGYSLGAIGTGSAYTKLGKVIAKSSLVGKVGETIKGISNIENATDKLKYIDNVNKGLKILDGAKKGTTAFITSVAEASANARSDKNEFKESMKYDITKGVRELTPEEEDHINKLADQVGNNSFMFNIPTIMADNWLTFGKSVFGNKATDKFNLKELGNSLEREGLDSYKLAKKTKIDNLLDKTYGIRKIGEPFLAEGTQEQLQFAITKGTNDYFKKKYYNPDSADFMESVAKGLSEAYGSSEGWDNFLIGAISGGLMGNATTLLTEGKEGFKNPKNESEQQALNYINSFSTKKAYKDIIESTFRAANIEDQKKEALSKNDTFEYENLKNDGFINYVSSRIKTGKINDLYSELEDFKKMTPEELKSNFGTEVKNDMFDGMAFVDNETSLKSKVDSMVTNKINQAKEIENTYDIINERFPNTSEANKDRLTYAALTIKNSGERKNKLSGEITKLISNNKHTLLNPTLLSSLSIDYNSLTNKESKDLYVENINNSSISPLDKEEILDRIKDIDKLTDREKAFTKEYNELTKEKYQKALDETDSKIQEEINNIDNNKAEEIKDKINNDEDLTEDELSFVDNNSDLIDKTFEKESVLKEEKKNKIVFDNINKSNIIPDSTVWDKDEDGYSPVGKIKSINGNEVTIINIAGNESKVDLDKLKDFYIKLNEHIPKETVAPLPVELPDNLDQDLVSTSITKKNLITSNQEINDNNPITLMSTSLEEKSIAAKANVAMMKLFNHYKKDNKFRFDRDKEGKVIQTNSNISMDINNPEIAKEGTKINFKLVQLSEEDTKENNDRINNSKYIIQSQIKSNLKETLGYTDEDSKFEGDLYTASIGIYSDNKLIGFVQLPHFIDTNVEKLEPYIEARKNILATRKLILDKLANGEEVESTIKVKGSGNLLTQIKDGKPVPQGNLISKSREKDKTNGKIALVYDNGDRFVLNGTQDLKDKYGEFITKLESFKTPGKIYQIVESANGYGLIPVYSNLISNNTANIIIEKLKKLPNNPSYNQVVNTLQDYIYSGNKLNRPDVDLNVYTNNNNIVFEINGNKITLNDIKEGLNIDEFKDALTSKRHNIAVNNINNINYQKDLENRNVLTTNAYTVEGNYFVQPYIEYDNIISVANTNPKIVDNLESNTPTNIFGEVDDYTKALNNLKSKGIDLSDDIQDDAFSRVKTINSLDRKEANKYLDTYFPFLTLSDLQLVSEVKGAMKDAIGMLRNTTVYLFEGADNKTLYHEAFHGVFRNLLNDDSKLEILKEALNKYGNPSKEEFDEMFNQLARNIDFSKADSDIKNKLTINKWLEEKLADEFADYSNNFINRSLGQKIIDFFKKILQFFNIIKTTNQSQTEKLFEDMMSKKYTGVTKQVIPYTNLDASFDSYSRKIGKIPNTIKNKRLNQISASFANKYYNELAKGEKPSKDKIISIFNDILSDYKNKLIDLSNSVSPNKNDLNIIKSVIDNFNEFKNQTIKQLNTDYKIKIKEDFTIDNTDLDLDNFDADDINLEGNTSKEHGQEFMSISGIKSASARLKLGLSFIPYLDNNGKIINDELGFPQYYKAENIYYWLERNLVGAYDLEEMLDRIDKASLFRPEFKSVYKILTDPGNHSKESFEQFRNQFRTNFAKQQMVYLLVTFEKTDKGNVYKTINSNRQGVKAEIIEGWKNNISIPNNTTIAEIIDNDLVIQGSNKAIELNKYFKSNIDKLDYSIIENTLSKLGIIYSDKVLKSIYDKDKTKLIKNINTILDYYSSNDKTKDKEFNESMKTLADYEVTGNINNYTSSFNNVEKKAIYTIQHSSFSSKVVSKIKNDYKYTNVINELRKDPINTYSNLLTELENDDKFRQEQFNVFYLNGLKDSKSESEGSKWTKMTSSDTLNMLLALYQNTSADQNITTGKTVFYSNVVESDKTLHSIIQGKSYNVNLHENTIDANSEIIDKFYNVVLGEANRIKKALNLKNKIENNINNKGEYLKSKLLQYYHYSKDSSKFDGTAYRFNTIDSINELLPEITKLLSKDYNSNVVNDLSSIESLIKNSLAKELTKIYNKTLKDANKKGIITINEDNSIKNNTLELKTENHSTEIRELIASFSANEYLFNIEYSNIMNGDSAFYKSTNGKPSDMSKRFYQANSQTKTLKKGVNIKVSAIDDLEVSSDENTLNFLKEVLGKDLPVVYSSGEINVTDAQVWVLPELYKSINEATGEWSDEYEMTHKIGELEIINSDPKYRNKLKAIKPFGFGYDYDEDLGINVYRQIKCSILPLYKSFLAHNPLLMDMRNKLEKSNTNLLATKSSLKAALGLRDSFNSSSSEFNNKFTFNEENFGIQVDNIDHMVDSTNSSIRQAKMLIPGNIDINKTYSNRSGFDIRKEINNLEAVNIKEDLESLKTRINSSEFNKDLKESLTSREATIAQETVLTINNDGQFDYPLDFINSTATENMINSVFTNKIVKQEFTGGSAVQASGIGYKFKSSFKNLKEQQENLSSELDKLQSDLKYIRADKNDSNKIDYIDCAIPAWDNRFYNTDGSLKNIDEIPEELRVMMVYRIPTEGYHSMMMVRVTSFLPKEYGNFMLLPYEITAQFGADFDFDKTYFITPEFKVEKNKLIKEEYDDNKSIKENSKAARNNRILDNYDTILRDKQTLKYLVKPSGFDEMLKIAKDLNIKTELLNYYTGDTQRFYKDLFHAIIGLKGQSANHVTGHSFFTMMDLEIDPIYIDNQEYKSLSRLSSDNNELISEELSSMMAAILDAVKNPDLLPTLGINDKTIDIWATLVHLGIGVTKATYFTASPAIKELSELQKIEDKKIGKEYGKSLPYDTIYSKYVSNIEKGLSELSLEEQEEIKSSKLYQDYRDGKYRFKSNELLSDIKYDKKNIKENVNYYIRQSMLLHLYDTIKPISDNIVDLNKVFAVNKEVGPNIENIIDKLYLLNKVTNDSNSSSDFSIRGFNLSDIPQLNQFYEVNKEATNYLNKYFPYNSDQYLSIKNKIANIQYGKDLLSLDTDTRMKINGAIRASIDYNSVLFKDIVETSTKEFLLKELPGMLTNIKNPINDDKFFNGRLRQNAFINQLYVTVDKKNPGFGYIALKGNRLTKTAKDEIIEAGLTLFNNPNTKNLITALIKHSFLTTGYFSGLHSYHSLIAPEIFLELGYEENTINGNLEIISDFVDYRKSKTEFLNKGEMLFDSEKENNIVDQIVRNFSKQFTRTYNSELFDVISKDEKNKPLIIKPLENSVKKFTIGENLIKYIRVYYQEYSASILFKENKGRYELINYLGKPGNLIELDPNNNIDKSILNSNNYVESKSNNLIEDNSEETEGETSPVLEDNNYSQPELIDAFGKDNKDNLINKCK